MKGRETPIRSRNGAEIGSIQYYQSQESSYQSFPGNHGHTVNATSKNQNPATPKHIHRKAHPCVHIPFSPKHRDELSASEIAGITFQDDHYTQCLFSVPAPLCLKREALCKSAGSHWMLARVSWPICWGLGPQWSRALINDLQFLPSSTLGHRGEKNIPNTQRHFSATNNDLAEH